MKYTDEQREQLLDLIAKWQGRLRLQHWTIRVKWDEPESDECLLAVSPCVERNMANVYIGAFFEDDVSDKDRKNAVVHELIHCHVHPVWEVTDGLLQELGSQARAHMSEVVRQRIE